MHVLQVFGDVDTVLQQVQMRIEYTPPPIHYGNVPPVLLFQSPGPHVQLRYPMPDPRPGRPPITPASTSATITSSPYFPYQGWITGTVVPRVDGRGVTEFWFVISYDLQVTNSRGGERRLIGSEWVVSLQPVS